MNPLIAILALILLATAALALVARYMSPEQRRARRGPVEVLRSVPLRRNTRRA